LWLIALLALGGAFRYLKNLKEHEDHFVRPLLSVETTRVSVARGLDPQATTLDDTVHATTLREMRALSRPDLSGYEDRRAEPFELRQWRLRARVHQISVRSDGDLYLVIDADGVRGVAEVPRPEDCEGSPFRGRITALRRRLEEAWHPSEMPKKVDREAELTGVGFFGTATRHDNGARLLPLLDIKWLPKG